MEHLVKTKTASSLQYNFANMSYTNISLLTFKLAQRNEQ